MSGKTKKPTNILVNPAEYASHLEGLEEHDSSQIQNLEEHLAHRLRLGGAITYIDEDGNHVIEDHDGIRPLTDGSTFPQAQTMQSLKYANWHFETESTQT